MDEDHFFNEKKSIRESARSLKKYGSTCNHVRNNEVLIRHELEKTDTLQGIALKYGCTVCLKLKIIYICTKKHSKIYFAINLYTNLYRLNKYDDLIDYLLKTVYFCGNSL